MRPLVRLQGVLGRLQRGSTGSLESKITPPLTCDGRRRVREGRKAAGEQSEGGRPRARGSGAVVHPSQIFSE